MFGIADKLANNEENQNVRSILDRCEQSVAALTHAIRSWTATGPVHRVREFAPLRLRNIANLHISKPRALVAWSEWKTLLDQRPSL